MLVEEPLDLGSAVVVFRRHTKEQPVASGLPDTQVRVDPGCSKRAMEPDGIGEEQIPCTRCQDGRRESFGKVTEQGGDERVPKVLTARVQQHRDALGSSQKVVETCIRLPAIS